MTDTDDFSIVSSIEKDDFSVKVTSIKEKKTMPTNKEMLKIASDKVTLGNVKTTFPNQDYKEAAKLYHKAAIFVEDIDQDKYIEYLQLEADAHYEHGKQKSDTALKDAIRVYRNILELLPKEEKPQQWAKVQNNLGLAFYKAGCREGGTDLLNQAIETFNNALEVATKEKNPKQWASIQNNLGNLFKVLGSRGETERYEQSTRAFNNALKVYTKEKNPNDWASIQNNLGCVFKELWKAEHFIFFFTIRDSFLKQSIEAFNKALEVYTKEKNPNDWAGTKLNLGGLLLEVNCKEEAIKSLEAAFEVWTKDNQPLNWAMLQNKIGGVWLRLGEFEKSITAFNNALEVWEAGDTCFDLTAVRKNLANAQEFFLKRGKEDNNLSNCIDRISEGGE